MRLSSSWRKRKRWFQLTLDTCAIRFTRSSWSPRSEEHTSELQSHLNLVCRLLLEKKKTEFNSSCSERTARALRATTSPYRRSRRWDVRYTFCWNALCDTTRSREDNHTHSSNNAA